MHWQPALPEVYRSLAPAELTARIEDRRRRLGERLCILGHHYQTDEVVRHADLRGDSLKLSQLAAGVADEKPVEFVVFCGVHFMAETADLLTPPHVRVLLPDLSAGCSMADMADYDDAVQAWDVMHEALGKLGWSGRVVPVTYVNSTAAIKAFVGANGGACCTSSNADQVFAWALAGGTEPAKPGEDIKLLFLPDQHLGRNTAAKYGVDTDSAAPVYDPRLQRRGEPLGGMTPDELLDARVILWAGHCSVHKLFRPEHCDQIRAHNAALPAGEAPTRILVHPECAKEVVDLSDLAGSTEFIIKTIEAAEPGSRWAVGTEHHLVQRVRDAAAERRVDVRILSDCQCMCTTMYRIDEPHLLWVLDGLCGIGGAAGTTEGLEVEVRNQISVHPEVRGPALEAVDRMLSLSTAPAID
ncbi:MAG: quinolinate synthase A [Phycisphaeraceae bacterium]|nr:MAG: quinolinate synthase A [Phycisphaeraceae bacterium]